MFTHTGGDYSRGIARTRGEPGPAAAIVPPAGVSHRTYDGVGRDATTFRARARSGAAVPRRDRPLLRRVRLRRAPLAAPQLRAPPAARPWRKIWSLTVALASSASCQSARAVPGHTSARAGAGRAAGQGRAGRRSSRRAGADPKRLQQHRVVAALGQVQEGREACVAAADDRHVLRSGALASEPASRRHRVGGRDIVGSEMTGRRQRLASPGAAPALCRPERCLSAPMPADARARRDDPGGPRGAGLLYRDGSNT